MTREEEIITACKVFLSRYPSIDQAGLSIGFLDGAIWSDKHPVNVWHNASEEPQVGAEVLIEFETQMGTKYHFIFQLHQDSEYRWEDYRKALWKQKIIRWAYISDLLPKQFRNSKQEKGGEE